MATDWGGTPVESWSSPDALNMCKKDIESAGGVKGVKEAERAEGPKDVKGAEGAEGVMGVKGAEGVKDVKGAEGVKGTVGPNTPSVLWNAMIFPFLNMTIKGAVWYQGESNSGITHVFMG